MAKHAKLSASAAHRWLACPPSVKLTASMPDSTSEYAMQGTCAHELCEFKLRSLLGEEVQNPVENLTFYDSEMEYCTDLYAQYVAEQIEEFRSHSADTIVLVEQRLDFSAFVPEGFGTGDCVIVSDGTLHVIDFKYGLGVLVEADKNPQMMCYALGALQLFDMLYDIDNISMTIFQPRREHISTAVITKAELLSWANDVLAPTANLALKGEGEFCAGDHCQFCKAKAACRKRAEYNLQLARYDFQMPPTLEDAEVEIILAKADSLASWVADIKEYATHAAMTGTQFADWKLVEGRSVRKYISDDIVATKVQEAGYDPYEKKVLGVTAMSKLLGKKNFEELLSEYIIKPQGKPTLVPKSDKRKAINLAANDFKEEN